MMLSVGFRRFCGSLPTRSLVPVCGRSVGPSRHVVVGWRSMSDSSIDKFSLDMHPIHLGQNASAVAEPEYHHEPLWFDGYMRRHENDGPGGRLVTMYKFDNDWSDETEMKSTGGDQVTMCLSGTTRLHQKYDNGSVKEIVLSAGEYAITPPGTWITVDVHGATSMLMITPFDGTDVRPRGGGMPPGDSI